MQIEIDDIEIIKKIWESMPDQQPPQFISEFIENRRILPSNTPIPGRWRNWRSYYSVEIMDCLSPWNPTQHVDVMSASQVVKTSLMENTIGYYMGAMPSPILFMSGTDALLKKWATKRLEPLIDSLNLRDRLIAPVENEKSRRTGDTTFQKLFNGGFLEMASAQSPSSQRSDSVRILCLDELDAAPPLLTTGEGYWDENAEARTKAWGNRRKILACSTPTEFQTSTIYRRFLMGDQCEYFVPCPLCGKFQLLERGSERGNHGIRVEMKNGNVDFVYYLCEHCHDAIFEHQKGDMIRGGKWEPKTKPERLRRSFHLNGLLSPVGMYSWIDYYTDYRKAQRSPDGMRVFTNHGDGLPYVDTGQRPKMERVLTHRGKYPSGTVPSGVLYLTMFVDVQEGSKKDAANPQRLELEVMGIGAGYKTWSIVYKKFVGDIESPYSGAWEDLYQWAVQSELKFQRREDGFVFQVRLILVDSGFNTSVVYQFCQRFRNAFPSKGFRAIHRHKYEKPDELSDSSFKRYRKAKINDETMLFEISTIYYKTQIYSSLNVERTPNDPQPFAFSDFPVDYNEDYFDMLTAEEKMSDGSFQSHGRRNEALDCRVGCLCAADIFLDSELEIFKNWARTQRFPFTMWGINFRSPLDVNLIGHRTVIDEMIRQTAIVQPPITEK